MNVDFDILKNVSESRDSTNGSDAGMIGRLCQAWQHFHLLPTRSFFSKTEPAVDTSLNQLEELFTRLEKDKTDLDAVARDIEERFLAMGTCVQELSTLSSSLLAQSERLSNSSGSEFKTHLQGALDVIRQQLDFVGECQQGNAQLIGRLESYIAQFQRLCNCEDDLEKILTPMQTVSVLFKIHSVSLENEEKSFFATLTDQIVALQTQARTTFGEQMQGLLLTGQSLSSSIPRLKEQSNSQGEKVRQKKVCIEESMVVLQRQFTQMQASHEQLSVCGKKLKTASGGAVMGLQYQDITRQKWEHVAEAVLEMREHSKTEPGSGQSGLTHDQFQFLRDISQIQIRQVQAIQNDLAQSQSTVSESVHAMLEELRGMDAVCQKMCGENDGSTAIEAMVKVLLEALTETRVWVSDLATMAQTTSKAVSSFDKTASDVAGTLRRLSGSIGMIAINAQVQVARIEDENGLDVLSESICVAANEIKTFSETVGSELDRLVSELHETILDCRKLEGKTQEQQRWLEGQGTQQDEQLHACRDATLSVQHEVKDSLSKIHEQATSTLAHSNFHEASHDGFQRLQASLGECARIANEHLGTTLPTATHSRVHSLKKNYTMESEREVFDATVAERSAPVRNTSPAPTSKDNRSTPQPAHEKRIAEPAVVTPAATPVLEPAGVSADNAQPVPAPEPAPEKKPDLGDNVELF